MTADRVRTIVHLRSFRRQGLRICGYAAEKPQTQFVEELVATARRELSCIYYRRHVLNILAFATIT